MSKRRIACTSPPTTGGFQCCRIRPMQPVDVVVVETLELRVREADVGRAADPRRRCLLGADRRGELGRSLLDRSRGSSGGVSTGVGFGWGSRLLLLLGLENRHVFRRRLAIGLRLRFGLRRLGLRLGTCRGRAGRRVEGRSGQQLDVDVFEGLRLGKERRHDEDPHEQEPVQDDARSQRHAPDLRPSFGLARAEQLGDGVHGRSNGGARPPVASRVRPCRCRHR